MASDVSVQLRAQVAKRAGYRCEYCLIHESQTAFPHQIDHVLSRKHGGTSSLLNLAYACVRCNRYKGSDVAAIDPETGEAVRLFNPRRDQWSDHFRLRAAVLDPITESGRATIRLLCLNALERIAERRLLNWLA